MFTGIVEGVGTVQKQSSLSRNRRIWVRSPFSLKGTRTGDSIAVDGCCLTVTEMRGGSFSADISPETLSRTTLGELKTGSRVNLERPLRAGDRLGGHLVQGHVDGVGKILGKRTVHSGEGDYILMEVGVPEALRPYVLEKGSVAVDGISLTVNEAKRGRISLCIIPHTLRKTALTGKKAGARVNLEVDLMLKYIEKMLNPRHLKRHSSRKAKQRW
jgi:riboflavin synthase